MKSTEEIVKSNSLLNKRMFEIEVELSESITKTEVMSTIVPHAHGWCP